MSFPGGSVIRNLLPSKQETWVPLGGEDPLEKEMATHSSILAWETPWAEEPGGLQWCLKRVGHDSATTKQQQIYVYRHTHMLTLIQNWMREKKDDKNKKGQKKRSVTEVESLTALGHLKVQSLLLSFSSLQLEKTIRFCSKSWLAGWSPDFSELMPRTVEIWTPPNQNPLFVDRKYTAVLFHRSESYFENFRCI